ncbi:hypothetical protein ESZ50_00565 [Weissella muntiaci]|uniref:Uncharacterized protein n=1 Tax=Weissella muntiaci TaxID=2508881 RepID=A0A6C2CA89_9LACO|nr:hypothetical protein [Weissella muntiaci]TYC51060.1 hypothetical protein ESZ50_00565 [Weissella muntiaci]
MTKKIWWIIGVLLAVVIAGGGTFAYVKAHPTKAAAAKMSDAEWRKLDIKKQFELAPEGHYVHLTKTSKFLYKTTWTKNDLYKWYGSGKLPNDEKNTFGTSKTFDNTKIVDTSLDSGEVSYIWGALADNGEFNKYATKYPDKVYEPYFDNLKDAKKDTDVSQYVTEIVR